MQIEIFTIAEAARVDSDGGMSILHTVDTFAASVFPMTVAPFCEALKIHFRKSDEGQKVVRIMIMDSDANAIAGPVEGTANIEVKEGNETCAAPLILNFPGIRFEKPGTYWVRLTVDGREEAEVPMYVRQIGQPVAG